MLEQFEIAIGRRQRIEAGSPSIISGSGSASIISSILIHTGPAHSRDRLRSSVRLIRVLNFLIEHKDPTSEIRRYYRAFL